MYDANGNFLGKKHLTSYDNDVLVIEWLRQFYDKQGEKIGYLRMVGTDVQNINGLFITSKLTPNDEKKKLYTIITKRNIIPMCIYMVIRHCIKATWFNDRDHFLKPNNVWEMDTEFQSNCLVYALFHGQNKISSNHGTNHWIPFTEAEVDAKERFESHFMSDYLAGKIVPEKPKKDLFSEASVGANDYLPLQFTPQAQVQAVMDAGRELWRYYHAQPNANPNASLYDIKEHFQGRNDNGKMNSKSSDARYTELHDNLKDALKALGEQIKPKVYEYGFLK